MNTSLVNNLAQVILSLPQEEQHLLQKQLAWQPRKSRSRRRVSVVETGDSFDYCVAEIAPQSCKAEGDLKNYSTKPEHQPQIQSEYQSATLKVRSIEKRSQKSLSLFREFLPS